MADDFCFLHALHTQTSAHPQGENFLNTGFTMEGFPSFGAWVTYALGSENEELPAFVAINDLEASHAPGKIILEMDSCLLLFKERILVPKVLQRIYSVQVLIQQRMINPRLVC